MFGLSQISFEIRIAPLALKLVFSMAQRSRG